MKKLGDFMFGKKLSHIEKNNCVQFQTDLIKCRYTTPICLMTVLECHDRDMA